MDRKTRRRLGALRRLLAERERLAVPWSSWRFGIVAPRPTGVLWIEQEIATLRRRIPADILIQEGLQEEAWLSHD